MLLTSFLRDLLTTGTVTLAGRPAPFEPADLEAAEELLWTCHAADALDMPGPAPAFEPAAARWAAASLYHAMQLALVRELDETVISSYLPDFAGEATAAAMYSADLTLRYLPDLLHLAKGLAPGDALVARLQALAGQWPLSLAGEAPADPAAEARVLAHPSLRRAYLDRIIRMRNRALAGQPQLRPLVQEALGAHAAALWPDFDYFTLTDETATDGGMGTGGEA